MPANAPPLYKRLVRQALNGLDNHPFARRLMLSMSHAHLLPRPVWQRLHPDALFTFAVEDQTIHYASPPNDVIGNQLFWTGKFEDETSRVFVKLARGAKTVLDVGANTGYFTLLACMAAPDSTVIAFEPVPAIFDLLQRNVAANQWQARCVLRREAVSNSSGVTEFHVPEGSYVPTSGSLNPEGFRGYQGRLIKTPVTTLDTVCADLAAVDLVKIDVEGFEDKVLEGMQATLQRCHPHLIVECNHDGPYQRIEAILTSFGYTFYALLDSGPRALAHLRPDPEDKHRNFLCSVEARLPQGMLG